MGIHRLLVTGSDERRMRLWCATGFFANWIEGRKNHQQETWLVTVFDENLDGFLHAAEAVGVTLEEIIGSGKEEDYRLLLGKAEDSWAVARAVKKGMEGR